MRRSSKLAGLALALLLPAIAGLASHPAGAADASPYLDDRSTPQSLIHSLYNAINRQEYARAYTYFDTSAVPDFDTYQTGFATTESVDLAVGHVSEEGAAGSTFWKVPVAIRSFMTSGPAKTFAGCYTLRLAQPQIQSPPFNPIHIVAGKLDPVSGGSSLRHAVPASCPD